MGNSHPKNRVGKQVIAQKLENGKKLGVLSLSEHGLETIPTELFGEHYRKLRTLDLSCNHLTYLGQIAVLLELKSLNLDQNAFCAGSLHELSSLPKLQSLSCSNNKLGKLPDHSPTTTTTGGNHKPLHLLRPRQQQQQQQTGGVTNPMEKNDAADHGKMNRIDVSLHLALPTLSVVSLRQLTLANNSLVAIPESIGLLIKLEKLDLSDNEISEINASIAELVNLQELRLDNNQISSLPSAMGQLTKLKVLSLKRNKFTIHSTIFSDKNPQPIPESLFTNTPLIDLNLHGNAMTNTELNQFEGFQIFLERRQKVKSKTMTSHDVCGLE